MRVRSSSLVVCLAAVVGIAGCGGKAGGGHGGQGGGAAGVTGTAGAAGSQTGSAGSGGGAGSGSGGGAGSAGGAGSGGGTTGTAGSSTLGVAGSGGGTTGTAGSGGATTGTGGGAGSRGGTTGTAGTGAGGMCLNGDVDVRATTVSGTIKVNGAMGADASKGEGTVSLVSATGNTAGLTTTSVAGGTFSTLVTPDTYDLYYALSAEGSAVPINTGAKLRSGIVVGASPLSLDINVPATIVSGTVTFNGAAITNPASKGEGTLWLRNGTTDNPLLTVTSPTGGTFSELVVPGTYDLYYSRFTPGSAVPINEAAKIQSGIVVGTTPLSLKIDVPATTVSGTVTIKGAAVTGANKGGCLLALRNAAGDNATLTGDSFITGAYSALVVPGTYDLYYAGTGSAFPNNGSAKIQSGIVVGASPLSLNVDVPATAVSGTVTVNGATVSGLANSSTFFSFRSAAGDKAQFATNAAGAFSTLLVPGTYDLYLTPANAIPGAPGNGTARLKSGIVVGSAALTVNVDIPATAVSGTVTVNGAMITDYNQGDGIVTLVNAAGDSVRLAHTTTAGTYSTLVIPGTYDIQYTLAHLGPALPNNTAAIIRKGIVVGTSPLSLDIDVPTATVSGTVTVNGAAIVGPTTDGPSFLLSLVGAGTDSAGIALISRAASTYSALVVPGSYELSYTLFKVGSGIPYNGKSDLGCFTAR